MGIKLKRSQITKIKGKGDSGNSHENDENDGEKKKVLHPAPVIMTK
jgi:hypothetical protein